MARVRTVSVEAAEKELSASFSAGSFRPDMKLLHRVICEVLTPKQEKYVREYYFERKSMADIAQSHGVTVPTVSRTLSRAKRRIYNALRYAVRS